MVELLKYRLFQVIFIVGPATTIVVTPWISFDPVSLPKLLVLTSLGFLGAGLLLANKFNLLKSIKLNVRIAALTFILAMLVTILFSGAPLEQQIWGVFGRNTGAVSYLALMLVLLGANALQDNLLYRRVVFSLLATSSFMTLYCLLQIAGRDPIRWSEYNTFGTLGNINFLSAFLGLSSVASAALLLDGTIKTGLRLIILVKIFIDTAIVLSTGSIQGTMILVAGVGIAGLTYLLASNLKAKKLILFSYLTSAGIAVFFTTLGVLNKGPLASFIYQPSVTFRGDYWHAGWALTRKFPFFGAGMDSYGDWYRQVRGEISTIRTNPERISNTAHNIFLDISSSGGLALILPYLFLMGLVLKKSIMTLRESPKADPVFIALISTWSAYQIQALVSINQIGVGVWGFIFSGCILGYQSQALAGAQKPNYFGKKFKGKMINPLDSLVAATALFAGFALAVIPMASDVGYRSARNINNAEELLQSTESLGASQFHKELVLDALMQSGPQGQAPALELAQRIVEKHPRSFFTWVVILNLPNSSQVLKGEALERIRTLDPFHPGYR